MEIKKLLFVTKFEELCFDALNSLLSLRRADLDHVVFLNVIERDKVAMHRGSGYSKEEEVKLKETANIRFIDWAESLFEMGLEVRPEKLKEFEIVESSDGRQGVFFFKNLFELGFRHGFNVRALVDKYNNVISRIRK